jgi:hypothetical protein
MIILQQNIGEEYRLNEIKKDMLSNGFKIL